MTMSVEKTRSINEKLKQFKRNFDAITEVFEKDGMTEEQYNNILATQFAKLKKFYNKHQEIIEGSSRLSSNYSIVYNNMRAENAINIALN